MFICIAPIKVLRTNKLYMQQNTRWYMNKQADIRHEKEVTTEMKQKVQKVQHQG